MTQEEKGKAYDELKVKAQELTEDGYIDKLALLDLFPELKEESEDEKIRKALLELVHDTTGDELWVDYNVHKEDALAWLEKQGTSYTKRDVDDAYVEGMAFAKNELEKQGEQKPADKVEPKFKVKYLGNEYNVLDIKENMGITWYGIEDEPNHIDYVKANSCEIINVYGIKENGSPYPTKPRIFAGHNPSDEDMKEALRTEYEKGRADAFARMQKNGVKRMRRLDKTSCLYFQICVDIE